MKFLNKRIISLALALVMLCGMMPMTALATEETTEVQNPFAGKTVSILSASTSTYAGVSNNTAANSTIGKNDVYYTEGRHGVYLKDTWWQQVIDALDMRLLVNNAWSGSCIFQPRKGAASVGYGNRAVNLHNDHTGEEPDIVWVYLGSNDFAYYQDTFGKAADVDYSALIKDNGDGTFDYTVPTTTCEAYAIMLHKIENRYPGVEIYCMPALARRDPDYAEDNRPDPGQPTAFNAELIAVAEHFGCTVINWENCIPKEAELFDQYIGDKRAHPNAAGMDLMSQAVISGMLGKETELYDISGTYTNVHSDNNAATAIEGGEYQAQLTADRGSTLDVTVTMGGVDVTQSVYSNGTIYIENVTGDIKITAVAYRAPQEFRWEVVDGTLTSTGKNKNTLTALAESISDGVIQEGRYQLETPVMLKHDQPWVIEWKCAGDWRGILLSTTPSSGTEGRQYLARTKGGQLCLGIRSGSQSNNYGVDLSSLDTQPHTYRLENRIAADGSNMVWLYLDGVEVGSMNNYFIGSKDQNTTSDWINGKDFVFPYIGMDTTPVTNCQLDYLSVTECAHTYENGICTGCGEELEPIKSHIGVSNTMGSTSGTHLEVIDFPVLPYSVYEISDGIYGLEDILSTKTEALAAYYVDSKSGSDDNSGTAENAPFRTLKKALTAAAGKAVEITILNENAVFFMDELYGNYAVNHTTVIKAKTGATILGGIRDAGFTLLDGYTNTYVSNSLSGYTIQNGDGVSAVVDTDARNVDEMGIYRALLPVSSVDEVESTKGSYYYDAEVARMYVNPRYNIESVYPLTATYPFRFNLSKAVGDTLLYMENLNVIGGFLLYGRSAASDSDFRNLEFVANNCTFQHNLLNNCVSVNNFNGSYMVDCRVGYSLLDGYNYHAANLTTAQRLNAVHVEVNCQAEYCGYYRMMFGVGVVNNNLSTAHEGINVLRVNFSGHDSYGPQIADVNGCRSVNIDCRISNSYQYKGSAGNFQFSQTSAIRNANITLINCYAYDSRSGELRLYSNVKRTTVVGGNLLESRFYTVIGDLLTAVQEHPHNYTAVVTAPTCAEQGYTTYTCTLCLHSYVADYADATGEHIYNNGICTCCGQAHPAPTIIRQPTDVQQELGKKFAITVEAEGEGLTYQWYVKEAGAKAFKLSVNKTSSYAYVMQSYMNGRQVYCVITDKYGNSVQTETATITRPPVVLTLVEQPKDAHVNVGEKFSISPKVEGEGLTYQWYVKESGAKAFKVSSNKTSAYAYTMQKYMIGRQVYCVITDKYGNSVTTDVATISLPPVELKLLSQPTDVSASLGEKFSISFDVQGDGLTYQWYVKEKGAKAFKVSSNKTSAYAYSMQNYMNGRQVYCVITDKYGNQVVTEVVTIHLET